MVVTDNGTSEIPQTSVPTPAPPPVVPPQVPVVNPPTPTGVATPVPTESFPHKYNWLLLVPVIAYPLSNLTRNSTLAVVFGLLYLVGIGSLIFLLIKQHQFIRRNFPTKNLRLQYILPAVAVVVVLVAAVSGDMSGASRFRDELELGQSLIFGVIAGIATALIFAFGAAVGNIFYIRSQGVSKAWKVVGIIAQTIWWLIVAVVAYFAYALMYTIHDPSTE